MNKIKFENKIILEDSRDDRLFIFDYIKKGSIGIEIGVAYGTFSEQILCRVFPKSLYLIEPHIPYGKFLKERFSIYDNVFIVNDKSQNVYYYFDNNSLDFVYIDSEHTYGQVKMELNNFFPKVKKGGLLIGDDYNDINYEWGLPIKIAVDEFIENHKNDIEVLEIKNLQYVLKKI